MSVLTEIDMETITSMKSAIARLEADKARLVEALNKIYRQDPYTTTDKAYFDFVYNTARDAVKEMEKSND